MAIIEEILAKAHSKLEEKLNLLKEEFSKTMKDLEDAIDAEDNMEYVMPESVRIRKEQYNKQIEEINSLREKLCDLHDSLMTTLEAEEQLRNITPLSFKEKEFIELTKPVVSYKFAFIDANIKTATKLTHTEPFKQMYKFESYCKKITSMKVYLISKLHLVNRTVVINGNKLEILNKVKEILGNNDEIINDFLDYLEMLIGNLKKRGEQISNDRKEFFDKETKRYIEESSRLTDSLFDKKSNISSEIGEVSRASYLYHEYLDNKDENQLKELIELFVRLGVLSQREVGLMTYKKEEKEIEEKEEKEEDIKPIEIKEEVKELELEYYLNKETQNIICFLGEQGNDIYDDLYDNFDNNLRPKVLDELVSLFNNLYLNKDPMVPTGIYPFPTESNKKTRLLLKSPFGFTYKRFFTGGKEYRMHTIIRHSKLLEDLGYGSGNIVFFGALGLNQDEAKDVSYSMLGRRAVNKRSSNNGLVILKPSFDYIEHITRGYIPKSLLSVHDKNRINRDFLGTIIIDDKKVDKSLEEGNYIYYYLLDDESKNNVYTYLNKYFMKQSTMMFKFIRENEEIKKGNNLD